MFERPVIAEQVRELIRATSKSPVRVQLERPYSRSLRRARVYIHRYASSLGVKIRVLTVDEDGNPLPPGELCIVRPGWEPDPDEEESR